MPIYSPGAGDTQSLSAAMLTITHSLSGVTQEIGVWRATWKVADQPGFINFFGTTFFLVSVSSISLISGNQVMSENSIVTTHI